MSKKKFLIIDGFSLMFRAFYSFPPTLTLPDNTPINAAFGFITLVFKAIDEFNPSHICICFDRPEPTFRKKKFPEYKAHRPPPPDDFKVQIPILYTIIQALGLPHIDLTGYEADDLIGTLATIKHTPPNVVHTLLLTNDQDCFQLVTDSVSVAMSRKGVSNLVEYTSEKVIERLGVLPSQVIDYKALRGDVSDNIPGVKGIGEKTAVSLLKEYGTLEAIYKNLDTLSSKSVQKKLKENRENAYLSQELATIIRNAPIDQNLSTYTYVPDWVQIIETFKTYQFTNLIKKYERNLTTAENTTNKEEINAILITTKAGLTPLISQLKKGFSIDLETTSLHAIEAQIVGISLCCYDSFNTKTAYYIPLNKYVQKDDSHQPLQLFAPTEHLPSSDKFINSFALTILKPLLEDPNVPKITHHGKYEHIVLGNYGITLQGISFDTMLAAYLLFPGERVGLKDLVFRHFKLEMTDYDTLTGKGKSQINFINVPIENAKNYAAADAYYTWRLYQHFTPLIQEKGVFSLFNDIELPTQIVLAQMEKAGVCIDHAYLVQLAKSFSKDTALLTEKIHALSGQPFNINSTQQLASILYDHFQLPVLKKTKTGRSTDSSVLEKLVKYSEFAQWVLDYRSIEKLLNTYVTVLPKLITPHTHRIHTKFNQTVAITGRLSSSAPNLQNIPIRTENGRKIRKAFIPSQLDYVIVSIDYSQIELRLMAHLSGDESMIRAFQNKEDIHASTAAIINNIPLKGVSKEMRYNAKAVNFGIIYGISAFGLSENLGIDRSEAKTIIENYFNKFPKIKTFMEGTIAQAKHDKWVKTEFGRYRPVPEINDRIFSRRSFAERAAINTRVQGTAADIMKLAMVKVQKKLLDDHYKTKMIIQVHDELVFDAPKSEVPQLTEMVRSEMMNVVQYTVPLAVDIEVGDNWLELVPLS